MRAHKVNTLTPLAVLLSGGAEIQAWIQATGSSFIHYTLLPLKVDVAKNKTKKEVEVLWLVSFGKLYYIGSSPQGFSEPLTC